MGNRRPSDCELLPSGLTIAVAADPDRPDLRVRAAALARQVGIPLADSTDPEIDLVLAVTPERIELRQSAKRRTGGVYADFVGGRVGHRRLAGGLAGQMLGRAVGAGRSADAARALRVCDATAGLGRDAFLLACMGCVVTAVERSRIVATLLADGIRRALVDPSLGAIVRDRLHLVVGESREYLSTLSRDERPDVVYLDPMFPHRRKSSLVKKEMRLCRLVAGDDADAGSLFETALRTAAFRVVVKRPLHAPPLGEKAAFCYRGTTIRYDVYLPDLRDATADEL